MDRAMFDRLILIAATLFSLFALAAIFWPETGWLARWGKARRRTERVLIEDILKHAHKSEIEGRRITFESIAGVLQIDRDGVVRLLEAMRKHQFLTMQGEEFALTSAGRQYALHIIRAHRLWESYLADQTGVHETEWHQRAEQVEHSLTRGDLDRLAAQLRNPVFDPHGDPIPNAQGKIQAHDGIPLTEAPVDVPLRITHIEDEPEVVFAQLAAEGFKPGMKGRITEVTPQRICLWTEGEEHYLAPIVARNLSVERVPQEDPLDRPDLLADLKPGSRARVLGISRGCRGTERRRFMDLGILPGTPVEVELTAPSGDPRAYLIRGTLVALREAQARSIFVDSIQEPGQ